MMFLILTAVLAFYVAWNLGANDVANSMGTSVGSKAVTLRQALVIAGILEFTGAVLFGHRVSATLATDILDIQLFSANPQLLVMGMMSALLACGLWLQLATSFGLPVASSHAVVGAIAGFGWVAVGIQAIHWQTIGIISATWVLTPFISGSIAALLYSVVKRWILDPLNPIQQLYEWIPWLSTALVAVFGFIVLPSLVQPELVQQLRLPPHDLPLIVGAIATVSLTVVNWQSLKRSEPAKHLDSSKSADSGNFDPVEQQMGRFQLLSACFVAFAHGSNDIGNAIAPLAAIAYVHRTGGIPLDNFTVPTWILVLGGIGIVSGLAVWGKNVITTIGEGIIPLKPSGGFCAELGAATTTLVASRFGLPISTSHALVGAVVGVGLVQRLQSQSEKTPIQFGTVRQIGLAWFITIPLTGSLAVVIFNIIRLVWS